MRLPNCAFCDLVCAGGGCTLFFFDLPSFRPYCRRTSWWQLGVFHNARELEKICSGVSLHVSWKET